MTSRENTDNLLRGRKAERVGLLDSPWQDTIAAWVEQGYPTRREYRDTGDLRWRRDDGRWVEAEADGEYEAPVPPWEHFGYDMAGVGPWFDLQPWRGYSELVEETDEWEVKRNGSGAALKYWKHKSGTPEHIDFRMTTREIWERDYRPHLLTLDPERFKLKEQRRNWAAAAQANRWTFFGHMFIWEAMRQSMGDVTLYESLLLDPDWVRDYNQVYLNFFKMSFSYMFEQVGKPAGIWIYEDMGYKNGLFASPKVLGDLIFPYYKQLVAFFHSHDLPVVLHTCGSTAEAVPLVERECCVKEQPIDLGPCQRRKTSIGPLGPGYRVGDPAGASSVRYRLQ